MYFGVEAVVAKSFARIHKENLINYGILPLLFKNKEDYEKIAVNDLLAIDDVPVGIDKGEVTVRVVNQNIELETLLQLSDSDRRVLREGGALNYLRNKLTTVIP